MSEKQDEPKASPDPFASMVQFYEAWSRSWAQAMTEAVSSKSVAESIGQQMESSMESLAMARKQINEIMERYLQEMSLPSRAEVISLAERMTGIEMKLDDIEAKLEEVLDALRK